MNADAAAITPRLRDVLSCAGENAQVLPYELSKKPLEQVLLALRRDLNQLHKIAKPRWWGVIQTLDFSFKGEGLTGLVKQYAESPDPAKIISKVECADQNMINVAVPWNYKLLPLVNAYLRMLQGAYTQTKAVETVGLHIDDDTYRLCGKSSEDSGLVVLFEPDRTLITGKEAELKKYRRVLL